MGTYQACMGMDKYGVCMVSLVVYFSRAWNDICELGLR